MTSLLGNDVGPIPGEPEILSRFIEFRLARLHTMTPARVIAFDRVKNQVDVQPLLLRIFADEAGNETLSLPQPLLGVPVLFPRGGGFTITWDLLPNDIVMLLFAERSIDSWSVTGEVSDPKPRRKHDWSDAVAVPGLAPELHAIPGINPGQLRIGDESGSPTVVLDRVANRVDINAEIAVNLGGPDGAAVGRVGDTVSITSETDPAFFAWIAAVSAAGPGGVTPYTGAIIGRIAIGSGKVRSE